MKRSDIILKPLDDSYEFPNSFIVSNETLGVLKYINGIIIIIITKVNITGFLTAIDVTFSHSLLSL
ncbi:hypothetical protein D3C76_1769080 [compost metagenome]